MKKITVMKRIKRKIYFKWNQLMMIFWMRTKPRRMHKLIKKRIKVRKAKATVKIKNKRNKVYLQTIIGEKN